MYTPKSMLAPKASGSLKAVLLCGAIMALIGPEVAMADVVPDPNNPLAATSTQKAMTANGQSITIKTEVLEHRNNGGGYDYVVDTVDVAKFTMNGLTPIVVTSTSGPITSCKVRPEQLSISTTVSGATCSFSISKPMNLEIQIDALDPLMIIATPHETETYGTSTGSVTVYPAGVSDVGVITAKSNHTYYLAPGAVVKGAFNLDGVENVRIIGRGLVDGKDDTRREYVQPAIYIKDSKNVKLQGVGIRNARGWQFLGYRSSHLDISYVNNIGMWNNNDGIDLDGVTDVTIRNSLIIAGDDAFGWHGMGSFADPVGTNPDRPMARILAENNTLRTLPTGSLFRFGASFESNYVSDVVVRDTYGLGWGSSGISIDPSDYVSIRNTIVENFYGTGPNSFVVDGATKYNNRFIRFELACQTWSNPNTISIDQGAATCLSNFVPGNISGVRLRNVNSSSGSGGLRPSLFGFNANYKVQNIAFEQVKVNGVNITSTSQLDVNSFTANVTVSSTLQPIAYDQSGVIDNGSAGFSATGSWYTSSLAGYGNSSSLFAANVGSTATWTPNIPSAGYYNVYVWYPHAESSSSAARYTVTYNGGAKDTIVDQTGLGGIWRSMGTYKFAAGTAGSIKLTVQAGNTRADAVKFEPANIVDNGASGFSTTGTVYTSSLTGFDGTSTSYLGAGATATWTPTIPSAKRYTVYVWYPYNSANDTAAKYTVTAAGAAKVITIDQTKFANQWRSIGTFDFAAGSNDTIKVESGGGNTRIDAIYVEPIPD